MSKIKAEPGRREPGKSIILVGPSGSGKSHFLLSALQDVGSGVVCLAPGADEIESFRPIYADADVLTTAEDLAGVIETTDEGSRIISEKPFLIAAFDDSEFFPSTGAWTSSGHESLVSFLRLVISRVRAERSQGSELSWQVLGLDTFSGVGQLAANALFSKMRISTPPKARGDGGAEFYGGYRSKLEEVSRACRAIKGYGLHWVATSHEQVREASDSYTAGDVSAKEQRMPLFTGQFREALPAMFDVVGFTGLDKQGKHYVQVEVDRFHASKSRYKLASSAAKDGKISNDWSSLMEAIKPQGR